ncbi:unnamed protein product [Polarella glacialis]|uniref:Glycosyl hydrolase-like 10 domain-containing protein n=1 Tax=Polarella glacialis TaxID=89957 RepID=A0A813IG58_POLGL|nr:unnamed protein product [Polarella glacialis]
MQLMLRCNNNSNMQQQHQQQQQQEQQQQQQESEQQQHRRGIRNYGFITRFSVSEAEARAAVRRLHADFGIVDFQFYDAFYSYSQPFPGTNKSWVSKPSVCFTSSPRVVHSSIISAYTDEIRKLPGGQGRSWLYVQAMAADEPAELLESIDSYEPYRMQDGSQVVWTKDKRCLFAYQLAPAWADRMVKLWAPAAASLGFDGIHWDQLGRVSDDAAQNAKLASGIGTFLERSGRELRRAWGLKQTFNFVDGFGWHPSLYQVVGAGGSVVEFPYWECWSDATEWIFWSLFNFSSQGEGHRHALGHAVFARYPDPSCCGNPAGALADDLMWARWMRAASACGSYLVLGDGDSRLVREYFPGSARLSDFERAAMMTASRSSSAHCAQPVLASKYQNPFLVAGSLDQRGSVADSETAANTTNTQSNTLLFSFWFFFFVFVVF